MGRKVKQRFWNFKRSASVDRSFLDWCGARKEPSVTEGMTHVETFLSDLAGEVGLRDGVTLDSLQEAWTEIVGPNIANNSEPIEIHDGALRVRVSQPVIKFELQQRQSSILKLVQERIPKAKVTRLYLVI